MEEPQKRFAWKRWLVLILVVLLLARFELPITIVNQGWHKRLMEWLKLNLDLTMIVGYLC